jgi:hypothetical protein
MSFSDIVNASSQVIKQRVSPLETSKRASKGVSFYYTKTKEV